jgi:hypothetical protein
MPLPETQGGFKIRGVADIGKCSYVQSNPVLSLLADLSLLLMADFDFAARPLEDVFLQNTMDCDSTRCPLPSARIVLPCIDCAQPEQLLVQSWLSK